MRNFTDSARDAASSRSLGDGTRRGLEGGEEFTGMTITWKILLIDSYHKLMQRGIMHILYKQCQNILLLPYAYHIQDLVMLMGEGITGHPQQLVNG